MIQPTTYYGFASARRLQVRRRSVARFFLTGRTQQVRSIDVAREVARALAALVALFAWGGVAVLLGS